MSTELEELSGYIMRLTHIYLDTARDGGDLVDAIADTLLPMGYMATTCRHYVDLVQAATEHRAEPVAEKSMLFSTFITNEEILGWNIYSQCIRSALVDEARGQWLDIDKEQAQHYAGCWTGFVEARPDGYYVWIEAAHG